METDIRNMKRKELQTLCKKHKILANLTNYEMANQLILLFKETKKPISKGKSCLRSLEEQASEDLSDGANKLSKKVRFSPENETFEFQASETKQEDEGRGARARKRSMIRHVEGIGGIVLEKNEDVVNNPVRGTRSRAAKVAPNVESVPTVETRMRTRRTLEIVEVENKEHVIDDEVLKKNSAKRISRNKGVIIENKVSVTEKVGRRSDRNAKQFEDGEAPKQGLSDVQVVETGRSKRQRSELVQNANISEAASKSEIELEVVLQIEEPPVRSSRYGTRRQSIVHEAENTRSGRAKDETGNNTLVLGTAFDHNARSKRTSRKAVAVSDAIVAENPVDNQPKNRRRGRVSEEQKGIIKGSPLVEEPPRKSSRQANRRQSIMPLPKNMRGDGFKDENSKHRNRRGRVLEEQKDIIEGSTVVEEPPRKSSRQINRRQSIKPKLKNTCPHGSEDEDENDKNTSKSSAVEENATSRRKSILNSDKTPVRNVRKATSRRMDPVLEEDNAVIEEVSSLVKQSSRKSPRSSAKAWKSLALSDKTGEKSMELCEISQGKKGVPQNSTNLENVNSPKVIGLAEAASGPAKLQNYQKETEGSIGVSGLSGIGIVLNIDTEDQVYKESVLENSNSGPEFDGESNVSKNGVLAEVSLGKIREFDQAAKQAKDVDSEKELELNKNSELESQASGALAFTNEEEETRTEFGASGFYIDLNIEKDAGVGIDKLSQEYTANEDDSDNLALVDSDWQSNSGFKMISDDDSETQEDEELPIEGRRSSDDDYIANSSSLFASEKPNESEYLVCPGATLVEKGYPIDQSVCLGKSEEKINLQMDMDENTELGKHRESISAISDAEDEVERSNDSEESHSAEVEVLDKSYREKNTPGELESIEENKLERSGMVDDGETKNDTDENYSAEVEVLDKSYGEKNTPGEAKSTPASEFGKVLNDPMLQDHQVPSAFPTVESAEDLNDVLNENVVVTDCLSPLSKESNSDKHSSPTLFKDLHIENPESSVLEANQVSQEGHNSGEQSGKQGFEDDSSTQPVESEDIEIELDADFNQLNSEIETQLLETTSPISGSEEYQGSLTELKDDDANNKGLFLGKNSATEKDNNTKSVIEGGLLGPTEYKDEDTQVIGSCVDTQCLEIEASPSALEASKSASEFVYSKQIPEEETERTGMMISEHGHDGLTANVINSVEESGDIMDEKAVENSASVGQADYSGNESGDGITHIRKELAYLESGGVAMDQSYSTSTALDMTGEEENEDFNIFEQSEGGETQYDDGMFDGLLGYEMEMVPEHVHAEKIDSPCNPDQFSGDSQAALKDNSLEEDEIRIEGMPVRSNETPDECLVKSQNLTSRADGEDASHCHTSNINDVAQCANELKEFAENQCWSPEPGLGNSQASYDSNMFGNWGYNIFSQGEAEKSNSVVSKVSFAEEHESVAEEQVATVSVPQSSSAVSRNAMLNEVYHLKETEVQIFVEGGNIGDTGADVMVHEEVKRCEVSITEVCVLEGTENSCFLGETNDVNIDDEEVVAKISDPVIGDRQSEYANTAFHGGDAGTSLVGDDERLADLSIFPTKENNLEVHMRVSRDISQGEISEDAVGQIPSSEIANSAVKEDSPTEDSKKDIELVSKENDFGKQSSLFLATPMKQATHFDMKENPSSIKRETQGSMAAKSTTKRRALTEIQK